MEEKASACGGGVQEKSQKWRQIVMSNAVESATDLESGPRSTLMTLSTSQE